MSDPCREAFEKWATVKQVTGKGAFPGPWAWEVWQAAWNARPLAEVPSVEALDIYEGVYSILSNTKKADVQQATNALFQAFNITPKGQYAVVPSVGHAEFIRKLHDVRGEPDKLNAMIMREYALLQSRMGGR